MMKRLLLLLLLPASLSAYADFAQIRDADGFTNVRANATADSPVIDKLKNGTWVYLPEHDEESAVGYRSADRRRYLVLYRSSAEQAKEAREGWVHTSRLQRASSYRELPVRTTADGFSCLQNGKGLQVTLAPFDYARRQQDFQRNQDSTLTGYRGRMLWGTDGTVPLTHYQSIRYLNQGKSSEIPRAKFDNLFNPYFGNIGTQQHRCFYRQADDTLLMMAMNSDGAAVYEVLFVFQAGRLTAVHPYMHPDV